MNINRRGFLKASLALGGAFSLEFSFPLAAMAARGLPAPEINAWVVHAREERRAVLILNGPVLLLKRFFSEMWL